MVRIFAAGDFHADISTARSLAQRAVDEKADIIVLNGDIVEEDRTSGVMKYFVETGLPVYLVPGNHDWLATDFLAAQYNVTNLHAKSIRKGDVSIFGCGGANVGVHRLTEEEILETVRLANDASAKKRVLISHVHPAGTLMEKFSGFIPGSSGLRFAIEELKPDVVLCGHVHEAEGIEEKIGDTVVINVGKSGRLIEL
ncbi:hypothetical protein D6825_03630 [Candidatus Woesearchaeota archaeon]|nr:MAG: hypothetical protein D6825_03630 [Candidatus Woesearchaeota archaeon]